MHYNIIVNIIIYCKNEYNTRNGDLNIITFSAMDRSGLVYETKLYAWVASSPGHTHFSMLHAECNIEKWVWPGDEANAWVHWHLRSQIKNSPVHLESNLLNLMLPID